MISTSLKAIAAAALLTIAVPASGRAADIAPVPDTSDWQFTGSLYLWAAGLDGKVGAFGLPPADIDVSFSDVVQSLDFAFMGMGEARNGRFMLGMDATYTSLGDTVKLPAGSPADKIDASSDIWMVTGVAGYAIYDGDMARLDVMAGARLWSINNDVNAKGGDLDGVSESDGATWVDPLVGAKLRVDLMPKVYAMGWGMIGGFGIGSDLMWDVMGGLGYDFNDTFSLYGGYRAASVDYSNDGFVYDTVEQGPVAAAVFKF